MTSVKILTIYKTRTYPSNEVNESLTVTFICKDDSEVQEALNNARKAISSSKISNPIPTPNFFEYTIDDKIIYPVELPEEPQDTID